MNSLNRARLFASVLFATTLVSAVYAQTATKTSSKPATATVYCAITDEKISDAKQAAGKQVVNGKTYYFCCPGCAPKFAAAPAKYARLADLHTEKRNLEAKLSAVNAALAKEIVKETKAVSMPEVKASTTLHCAITDEQIASVKDAAGTIAYNGKSYYFCCPGCIAKFKADPAKYAVEADKHDSSRAKN